VANALSLWQPWASLIVCGAKQIETRSWPPPARATPGRLLIHAARRLEVDQIDFCLNHPAARRALAAAGFTHPGQLPLGAIVGDCRVVRSYRFDGNFPRPPEPEASFGDYTHGRYGWVLEDARALRQPIPFRGMQSVFEVPDSLLDGAEWVAAGALDAQCGAGPAEQPTIQFPEASSPSPAAAADHLADVFDMLDDRDARGEYVLDLGGKLRTPSTRSRAWASPASPAA